MANSDTRQNPEVIPHNTSRHYPSVPNAFIRDPRPAGVLAISVPTATLIPYLSPLRTILYTSPTTTLFCIPLALGFESSSIATDAQIIDSPSEILLVVLTMLFVATLVFVLLLSEYWLVDATSSLALSVAGMVEELITVGRGLFFFSESLDLMNVIGFVLCQAGILMYVKLRYDKGGSGDDDDEDDGRRRIGNNDEAYMTVDSSGHDVGGGFGRGQGFEQEGSSLSIVSSERSEISDPMELS
mmetsp:Transcript_6257/g.13772  ORF Transcript_6257/g.13772 Transcript_6257/m.13772 type:complete len:242 (-) Transcript_6257:285-1010(-)